MRSVRVDYKKEMPMSRELMTRYRTKIIEDFIMIEGYVNAIICKHYFGHLNKDFMLEVLFDELCSTALKANLLEKALNQNPDIKTPRMYADQFRQMSRYRNYFAHCNSTISESGLQETPSGIPDPRKPNRYLNIDEMIKQFSEMCKSLSDNLIDIMDKMGILFIQDTDKGVLRLIFENPKDSKASSNGNPTSGSPNE
jgi:hypothetical protein